MNESLLEKVEFGFAHGSSERDPPNLTHDDGSGNGAWKLNLRGTSKLSSRGFLPSRSTSIVSCRFCVIPIKRFIVATNRIMDMAVNGRHT